MCNPRGNVLALMPHPERAQDLAAMPRAIGGAWGERRREQRAGAVDQGRDEAGPGLELFAGLAHYLKEA